MKKLLYIFPLIAMAFASCNSQEDLIFSESAADRLNSSRVEAEDKLTADGGLWAMEYFANDEEAGYVMLFRFDKNGSVEVSANHKWIDNQFKQERSLWKISSDNGTVPSFNSYNSIFHIFSDPADITGPNQPINPDTDREIDETGYGHAGDYEFMIMKDDNHDAIRMLGKKTDFNIYMYRLPSDTNEKEYLEAIDAKASIFDSKFKTFIMTDSEGHEYEITGMVKGIPSQFPRSIYDANGNLLVEADPVSQTTSMHGIFTDRGFRFSSTYTVKAADDTEWDMPEFFWAEDGTLVNNEAGLRITATSPIENLKNVSYSWKIDASSYSGKLREAYQKAYDAVLAELGSKNLMKDIVLDWANDTNEKLNIRINSTLGTKKCYDWFTISGDKGNSFVVTRTVSNSTSERYNEQIPALNEFKNLLMNSYDLTVNDYMNPTKVHFSLKSDPASGFDLNIQ